MDTNTTTQISPGAGAAAGIEGRDPALDSVFMKACRREATPFTPIWLMRQAGRYQPSYREIREKVSFLQLCKSPVLAAEVTVRAVEELSADAAILFADLLPIIEPMGLGLEYQKGDGPVIARAIRHPEQVAALPPVDVVDSMGFVYEAVRLIRKELRPGIPLLGFCGAPFTLASYMIEGGSSRELQHTKTFMYRHPEAWHALLSYLAGVLASYLDAQVEAGVHAVQVFDSWVGALGPADYRSYVLPHSRRLIAGVTAGTPVIHFGTGTASLLEAMRDAGGDVIGVDFRMDLDAAWGRLGDVAVQGNLDPVALLTDREFLAERVDRILDQAAGRPGHIFNLGHGILQQTPPENARTLVELVHERSADRGGNGAGRG